MSRDGGGWRRRILLVLGLGWLLALMPLFPGGLRAGQAELAELLRALELGDFARARRLARADGDPALWDHVRRREALARPQSLPLEELIGLITRRPHWPGMATLRRWVERRLDELPPSARREYLRAFPPLSDAGRLALAELLLAEGEREGVRRLVRAAWPGAELSRARERQLRNLFAHLIDGELEARRAEAFLWRGRWREARRLLPRVAPARRALIAARIHLQQNARGVDRALRRVPVALRADPGLRFDRIRWRLARGRLTAASELLRPVVVDPEPAARWWRLRRRLVWAWLERGRMREAWELLSRYRPASLAVKAEAGWRAGWLELRHLRQPDAALARFRHLYQSVRSPVSRARMAYWAGRAAARLGRPQLARTWYRRAAAHPTTFYGQEALRQLGEGVVTALRAADEALARPRLVPAGAVADERLALAMRLCRAGGSGEALPYLRALAREATTAAAARSLLEAVASCSDPHPHVALARSLARRGLVPRLLAFPLLQDAAPLADTARRTGLEPALLMALARQESGFAPRARSPAGARGLTQLMPATARSLARRHRLPFSALRLEHDPAYQLDLAARYLRELLDRFGDPAAALAAYNAGPARVQRWIKAFGDPRRMDRHARLDWIERIPYAETRNYVQRVLEGAVVYRVLAEGAVGVPRLTLAGLDAALPRPRPKPGKAWR